MPRGWVRTRFDKEGNELVATTKARAGDVAMPDLDNATNARRAAAVLRDVARHLERGPALVDPLDVVWQVGRHRTDWSVDCALVALRERQTTHDPTWTAWPPQVPTAMFALACQNTAAALDADTCTAPPTRSPR